MKIHNFAESNSIINHYMAELRDKNYQKNRLTFRHNVERIGELMAYEVSKTLEYKPKKILYLPLYFVQDYLSTRVFSMFSTVPTMLLFLPTACISIANILR